MGDSTTTRVTFGMCAEVAFRRNSDNASGISAFIYFLFQRLKKLRRFFVELLVNLSYFYSSIRYNDSEST